MHLKQQQIKDLQNFEARSREINGLVIADRIPRYQKTLQTLTGAEKTPSKNFFYRQKLEFADFMRRNLVARAMYYIASVYFSDVRRGEKLVQFFESFFSYLRASVHHQIPAKTNAFDWLAEQATLHNRRTTEYAKGNKQVAREISQDIQKREKDAAVYLKSVAGKFRKPGRAKKRVA